jgi:hypothetical protein
LRTSPSVNNYSLSTPSDLADGSLQRTSCSGLCCEDRSFDAFCPWFDWQHYSMLIDLCDEPLTDDLD